MNGTRLRKWIVGLGAGGTLCVRRDSLKTLLVGVGISGVLGLLPG